MTADDVISFLGLEPLPDEGGMFGRHYADPHSTAIYFLVRPGDFSALHRLSGPEVYHFYAGAPLRMVLLYPDGRIERPVLGSDLAAGERPALAVGSGVWQGSMTTGDWSLVGATMAPGFKEEMFEL
ncbi:MAG: cupin domain-containing protein, partial [Acidimicrobiia bacterium]